MQPTQSRPGYFWTTDDVAQLWFGESGPEPPQSVRCYNMQDHLNSGEAREVPVSELEFLGAGIFGEARPSGSNFTTRWTGDSYRYGIYRNPSGLYKNGAVVLEHHGGGMFGYAFDNQVAGDTWGHIAVSFPPEMIWNLCHQIVRAYRAARDAERQIVYQAFADGRLNKRRRNHRVYVEMIAA